ncbi:CusA/CzcA family heavy metal efflux RND transporter [Methyloceanibacter sp.]|uniref:efflux RND transporter permease subunit n=1 Tax=Methyloceanibacter sp. TaxID=1965321 RepID=UPI002BDA25F4|nr:CusA/CzcA family heavy metal efflux RND transporter [Methyloceanibacter sp.]HML90849.1 CusA/CzcA family heavy metal efflux RND transporter [Methyloceanibacter sp.]
MRTFIEAILRQRLLVCIVAVGVLVAGFQSYRTLPVDAFPDVSPTLVQVFTETEGLAPEEVERYVTYPIEVAMNGLPGLKTIRSISNFGLSVVNVYFEDSTDIYFARQLVGERLQTAREEIPEGFGEPEMGPITTGLGQILFYYVEDAQGSRTPEEMREIQDWIIKFNLQTVPGVTEILSLGGEVKQFQVQVDPQALLRYRIGIGDVVDAVKANNGNAGAQYIVKNSEQYLVRSIGLATGIADIEDTILKVADGVPVKVRDIGKVEIGGEVRQGLATKDGEGEIVAGLVLKLIGTNTSKVISDVKERLDKINAALPEGVRVVPYYDQSKLVLRSVDTVNGALAQGIILVVLVLLAFMGGLRPSLVVAFAIPFSICVAFIFMGATGLSANLMSLGGIAIAIGIMVDGAIVIVENVDRYLKEQHTALSKRDIVARACAEVVGPIAFAIAIIIVVFLPLFTLQGYEGKTFRPLAFTVSLAMLGSLLFAIFVAPVLSEMLMRRPSPQERDKVSFADRLLKGLIGTYRPLIQMFVRMRVLAVGLAVAILAIGVAIFPRLGSEFVPRLNEGDLLVRVTMASSIALEEARETVTRFEKQLLETFPEVDRVVSRVGRGEVGAHADPVNNAEAFVGLKPQDEWPSERTPAQLFAAMSETFESFPGAKFNFTQPIAAAVDELLTGTKAELAIKLFGDDQDVLLKKAGEIEQAVREVPGAADVQKDQVTGTPQLQIRIDRGQISRYGLTIDDVQSAVRTAIGGETAGQVFEGVRRFDILVRYGEEARTTPEAIRELVIRTPAGLLIPLRQVAEVEEIVGPRQITRENTQRFITIQANVRGRDIGSFVAEGQERIAETVDLPSGYLLEWGGQFELQQEANRRLAIVVPITLGLVFLLLFMNFGSLRASLLIMLNIPLALVGGVVALWLADMNLSVPASVGFIALFGIALENGMVLVTYLNWLVAEGKSVDEASVQGACMRLRPVLMTALTTALGLIPLLYATGAGSEVQAPLATVVVGGLVSSTVLTLLVIPAVYKWFVPVSAMAPQKADAPAE